MRWGELLLAVGLYTAAAIYFTWPLALRLSDHVAFGTPLLVPDVLQQMWILASVANALVSDPATLFTATAFHPTPDIIAASEHLLGDQLVFGPVWLATGNPVLAFNCLTLTSFVLCALSMHLLVRSWTASTTGAVAAALAFAFASWRLELGRAHLLHVQYFPLILLFLDRAAVTGRLSAALLAALALTLQVLSSYYIGYMAYVLAGCYLLAYLAGRGVRGHAVAWGALAMALLAPLVVIAPLSLPYLRAEAHGALPWDYATLERSAATVRAWSVRYVTVAYVGLPILALGVIGSTQLASWQRDRRHAVRVLSLVLSALAAYALAVGPAGPASGLLSPYAWLAESVPGFARMRSPVRFGCVAGFALSALAGLAIARLLAVARSRGGAARMLAPLAAGAGITAVLAPVPYLPPLATRDVPTHDRLPAAYRWLTAYGEGAPLLELPIGPDLGLKRDLRAAEAMYLSTFHRLPLVNGHTSYPPAYYPLIEQYAAQLPAPHALERLVDCVGVHWILAHGESLERLHAWNTLAGVSLRGVFPSGHRSPDFLFEVRVPPRSDCAGRLFASDATLDGNPVASLPEVSGRIRLEGLGDPVVASQQSHIIVIAESHDRETWPGTALDVARRVGLDVSWFREGQTEPRVRQSIPLPGDVAPGARQRFDAWLRHPVNPGRYIVRAELQQGSGAHGGAPTWDRTVEVASGPRRPHGRHSNLPDR